jgi:hypothetical protein
MHVPLTIKRLVRLWGGAAIFLNASAFAAVVDYPSAVQALSPNHYYRLNETVMGAVSDIGSTPLPAAHEGSFPPAEVGVDGAPDLPGLTPGNRALFDNNFGGVRLGPGSSFANDTMSVAMWFLAPAAWGPATDSSPITSNDSSVEHRTVSKSHCRTVPRRGELCLPLGRRPTCSWRSRTASFRCRTINGITSWSRATAMM